MPAISARVHCVQAVGRFDENHVLVQARDLGPWYAELRRGNQLVHGAVIEQARRDFGLPLDQDPPTRSSNPSDAY